MKKTLWSLWRLNCPNTVSEQKADNALELTTDKTEVLQKILLQWLCTFLGPCPLLLLGQADKIIALYICLFTGSLSHSGASFKVSSYLQSIELAGACQTVCLMTQALGAVASEQWNALPAHPASVVSKGISALISIWVMFVDHVWFYTFMKDI